MIEGADVEVTKVIYHWNLAKDEQHRKCRRRRSQEGLRQLSMTPQGRGTAQGSHDPVQDPQWGIAGKPQSHGIRLSGVNATRGRSRDHRADGQAIRVRLSGCRVRLRRSQS
jgi:hypothetical protein